MAAADHPHHLRAPAGCVGGLLPEKFSLIELTAPRFLMLSRRTVGTRTAAAGVSKHTALVLISTQSQLVRFAKGVISARPTGANP